MKTLICDGDMEGVIRQMERRKMTPEYFQGLHIAFQCELDRRMYLPVSEAAACGQLDIMNAIIERGFDPESQDSSSPNWRAIHWACLEGELQIVKCLVEDHSVDLEARGEDRATPLLVAIQFYFSDIVKYLIESGASMTDLGSTRTTALHECVLAFPFDMVEYVLSKGVDVNARCLSQKTPLFETVFDLFETLNTDVLLDWGAEVNAKDKHGTTTFLLAAREHQEDLMRVLVSRGADPGVVDKDGDTALHHVFRLITEEEEWSIERHKKLIKYLVGELGLECLNTKNSMGITPFLRALQCGYDKDTFELLVNYGCNVTNEFDMLNHTEKRRLFTKIPNCIGFFQHLKQLTSPPRSLQHHHPAAAYITTPQQLTSPPRRSCCC